MEPDTVPYDADAEWQGWQVQVPSSFAVQNQAEVTPEAVPPTIMYDTFMAEPFSAPEPPAGRTAPAEDSTQAYEAVPGGIPQAFQVTPTPAMAATQEYGDTLVLEHEGDTQEVAEFPSVVVGAKPASPSPSTETSPVKATPPKNHVPSSPARPTFRVVTTSSPAQTTPPSATASSPAQPTPHAVATKSPSQPTPPAAAAPAKSPAQPTPPASPAQPTPPAAAAPEKSPPASAVASHSPQPAPLAAGSIPPQASSPAAAGRTPPAILDPNPHRLTPERPSQPTGARLDTSGAASSSASKSGLKRLFGKQPPPPGYKPPKRPRTSRGSKRATAAASPRARPASSLPPMAGCRVRVTGDGWGGGTGEYEATVVDGDDLSYTIIYIGDDKKYTETHVLQEHCTLLEPPSEASTSRA